MADLSRLRARYGAQPRPRQLINMAIRDDFLGGAEILAAATELHSLATKPDAPDCVKKAFALLVQARDKLSEAVLNPQDAQPPRG